MSVIQPHEKVFLGHKINKVQNYDHYSILVQVQYAGNIREKIAQRALACCVEPGIVFDYDHRLKEQWVFKLFYQGQTVKLSATW